MTSGDHRLQLSTNDASIDVIGEIDAATAPQLDACLASFAPDHGVRLDVSGVTFLDSSALRVLVAQHQRFDEAGGRLEISNASQPVIRLFEITSLGEVFHIAAD